MKSSNFTKKNVKKNILVNFAAERQSGWELFHHSIRDTDILYRSIIIFDVWIIHLSIIAFTVCAKSLEPFYYSTLIYQMSQDV